MASWSGISLNEVLYLLNISQYENLNGSCSEFVNLSPLMALKVPYFHKINSLPGVTKSSNSLSL